MIIEMPSTTTNDVNKRLVKLRDEGGAVALGRVLTLVIDVGDHGVEAAIEAANFASREHPCRVIVIAPNNDRESNELDAQIRIGGDAGASEVIVLHPSGELRGHGDTLVIPLLLPDAPIVAWWPYEPPANPAADPIGRMAQRRITDSTECSQSLQTLQRLSTVYSPGDTDLAWTRITLWRGLLAAALDQPPYESVTRAVVAGNSTHPSVDLIAAWLAQELRCPVEIERQPDAPAITLVSLERKSGPIVLDRPDGKTAALRQPDQPEHRIALPIRQLSECLAEELRRLDADEVYADVLTKGLARL
ncbi:glucose-6-phosphate dehydrogenase assembly protein OpcA [Pengzhenrongella frigida]|uniref:Glucose-6-phosphate dehydrogenase assembly protein OpcA n=1 Tax=Pengzhenrongella frigida TaxID=1259133 RepID=A0A4Q5N0W5_9MICO|nr:glucose-6-phosphate dehydrogenase assembly protein OpcA [Cellulomonas sp. HLT2-17]RYV50873.1 glucose-6-phosphate dehydrogenase assembly protein OpcA [Cellulomonas sp. HLT2-17]